MMKPFTYTALPSRVVFDVDAQLAVAEELRRLDASRALVLSTTEQAADAQVLAAGLEDLAGGVFSEAAMHTPVDVTRRAMEMLLKLSCDAVVALGGGSTIGLGKALTLRTGVPLIAVPTTYAGSEATPILGETIDGIKTTQRTLTVLPKVVIYDVNLTLGLPVKLTVTSGLNAIAHACEALYAEDANPIVSMLAADGIARLAGALPRICREPRHRAARSDALYGAWACGSCLGSVGMALHHKLCHVLGGSFGLPHAETHAVLLPQVIAFNYEAAPEAMTAIAHAIGARRADAGLFDFARSLDAPASLAMLGMPESALDRAADLALANPYWNPRPVTHAALRALLQSAYRGDRPEKIIF
jgi:maleylacetate reductase